MPLIELVTHLSAPPERAFDLSLDVDAHQASARASGERAVEGVVSGGMKLGDLVTWDARHFGLRFRMTVEITAFERPHRFVDEMRKGPFASLRHEHLFEPFSDDTAAGTKMTDRFAFASPLGPLGRLVDAALLERYLRSFLVERNRYLRERLAAENK